MRWVYAITHVYTHHSPEGLCWFIPHEKQWDLCLIYSCFSEMNELEQDPAFDQAIKIKDVDTEKKTAEKEFCTKPCLAPSGEKRWIVAF